MISGVFAVTPVISHNPERILRHNHIELSVRRVRAFSYVSFDDCFAIDGDSVISVTANDVVSAFTNDSLH